MIIDNLEPATSLFLMPIGLAEAYSTKFVGNAAKEFIDHLERLDEAERANKQVFFFKTISVVQSSGSGKSRMLTEVC